MSMAIFLKSESCDYYLYSFDHEDIEQAIKTLKEDLGWEFAWVEMVRVALSNSQPKLEWEYADMIRTVINLEERK